MFKKLLLLSAILFSFGFAYNSYAQSSGASITTIAAKDLFNGLKNKSLTFDYNQPIIITGVLKDIGSSFIYNSSYLLISDKTDGQVYVKAVLADKNKKSEYKKGQVVKIEARFYEEREKVVVVKDSKSIN